MTQTTSITEEKFISLEDLITLKDAQIPGGALAMRPLNPGHVQQLASSNMERWPAILVTRLATTNKYLVIDGYHRWEACKIQGTPLIKAIEQTYPDTNALIDAAFRANVTHGLKASLSTRGDYAFWLHCTFPKFPQEKIAERCGLTQGAVSKAIARRERALMQEERQEADADPRAQRRSCRRFTKEASRFFSDVVALPDEELVALLTDNLQESERARLARIGLLLAGSERTE